MSYCEKCGFEMTEGTKFCSACGAKVDSVSSETQQTAPVQSDSVQGDYCTSYGEASYSSGSCETQGTFTQPEMPQGTYNAYSAVPNYTQSPIAGNEESTENKVFAALSYIGLLVLVPWFAAPDSQFVRFHARQGVNLLIVNVIYWLFSMFMGLIDSFIISTLVSLIGIPLSVFAILGIVYAAQGKMKGIPLIEKINFIK